MSQNSHQSNGGKRSKPAPGETAGASAPGPFLSTPPPREGVDPDKVARARRLLEQADYPPPSVLQSVARHLASNWPSDDAESGPQSRA